MHYQTSHPFHLKCDSCNKKYKGFKWFLNHIEKLHENYEVYEVEKILDRSDSTTLDGNNEFEFLIKWRGTHICYVTTDSEDKVLKLTSKAVKGK